MRQDMVCAKVVAEALGVVGLAPSMTPPVSTVVLPPS